MFHFDQEKHRYTVDGKPVPSVTQIPSRIGVRSNEESQWLSISGSEFMQNEIAARFGIEFHKIPPYILNGIKCTYDPAMEPWVRGLKKFLAEHKITPELVEESMCSTKYGYAGTIDIYGHIYFDKPKRIEPIIIDWKTSTSLYKSSRMQTAAYEQLIKENLGINRRLHRWTVRIFENGYEVDKRYNHPQDFNIFLSLLNIYKNFSKE